MSTRRTLFGATLKNWNMFLGLGFEKLLLKSLYLLHVHVHFYDLSKVIINSCDYCYDICPEKVTSTCGTVPCVGVERCNEHQQFREKPCKGIFETWTMSGDTSFLHPARRSPAASCVHNKIYPTLGSRFTHFSTTRGPPPPPSTLTSHV